MIEVTVIGAWALVELDGEFDLANAAEIADAVDHLVQQAVTEVTVDVSLLTFIDASGINALMRSVRLLSTVNDRMVIVGANPWLRRVFAAAGVADTLPVVAPPERPDRQPTSDSAGAVETSDVAVDALTQSLFELAGSLLRQPTTTGDLRRVIDTAVSAIPGCTAASVTVIALGAPRSAAVTNQLAVEVDVAQYRSDEGPCLYAARNADRIRFDVLGADQRFAHFAPLALETGIRAVLSVPILAAGRSLGSLNLYSESEFGAGAETMGELLAAQSAAALAKTDILAAVGRIAGSAQRRFDDLAEIAIAEGVLAGLHDVGVEQAARLLRSGTTADSGTLVEAAQRIIATVASQEPPR